MNSATVLDKDNHVNSYRAFLEGDMWETMEKAPVPTGGPAGVDYYVIDRSEAIFSTDGSDETEGFFDLIKTISRVVLPVAGDIITAGAPFLGPIGAVVAPLAGVALHGAAKLAETSLVSGTESAVQSGPKSAVHTSASLYKEGAVHRAILGEAALHAISRLPEDALRESGALMTMSAVYTANEKIVENLTPQISRALLEPTLRISMDELHKAHNPRRSQTTQVMKWAPIAGAESAMAGPESESEASGFLRHVVADDAEVVDEAFFPDLLNVIKKGALIAAPFVTGLAREGLDKLDKIISDSKAETEFSLVDEPNTVLELLPKRALLGEAALQAIMKLPKEQLYKQYPKPGSDSQTEGLIDVFKTAVQKIGPKVLAAAPIVMKHVTPMIQDLLTDNTRKITSPLGA